MAITPAKDANNVTLGLGILGLADFGGSPYTFVDVGYIKSMTMTYNRELKDFESAGILVKRLAFRDSMTMTADWAEIKLSNLQKAIPGSTTGSTHKFGGDRTIDRYAVRFEHTRDDGQVITVDMYKATPASEFELAFAEEEFITYPVEFSAEADTTKATGQQYGSVRIA